MTCSGGSTSIFVDQKEYQDLSGWKGIGLEKLLSNLQSSVGDEVRIYTVASTKLDRDAMAVRHLGSGPNLEGGVQHCAPVNTACDKAIHSKAGKGNGSWD